MSIRNAILAKPPIPIDLAEVLESGGITTILNLIRDAYFDLIQKRIVSSTMDENEITEEWFVCLQLRWQTAGLSLVPIHEKPDKTKKRGNKGKPPTIDCCFRNQWHKQSYFGIECKLVEANNKTLCDKYVQNGVQRFIDCRYSSRCSEGAMLGYVRQTQCNGVAAQLSTRINTLDEQPELTQTNQLLPLEQHYISKHCRTDCLSPFVLHHFLLFFDVS
ncbi:MAG: hypothetical protein GY797_40180 [Deltaproteobacteria bacterium]|nr:hypothetical protein [Deltaproteobacteria bacterium]